MNVENGPATPNDSLAAVGTGHKPKSRPGTRRVQRKIYSDSKCWSNLSINHAVVLHSKPLGSPTKAAGSGTCRPWTRLWALGPVGDSPVVNASFNCCQTLSR